MNFATKNKQRCLYKTSRNYNVTSKQPQTNTTENIGLQSLHNYQQKIQSSAQITIQIQQSMLIQRNIGHKNINKMCTRKHLLHDLFT